MLLSLDAEGARGESMTVTANICEQFRGALFSCALIPPRFQQPQEMGIRVIIIISTDEETDAHASHWKSQDLDAEVSTLCWHVQPHKRNLPDKCEPLLPVVRLEALTPGAQTLLGWWDFLADRGQDHTINKHLL